MAIARNRTLSQLRKPTKLRDGWVQFEGRVINLTFTNGACNQRAVSKQQGSADTRELQTDSPVTYPIWEITELLVGGWMWIMLT